jgi:hypothetical protein
MSDVNGLLETWRDEHVAEEGNGPNESRLMRFHDLLGYVADHCDGDGREVVHNLNVELSDARLEWLASRMKRMPWLRDTVFPILESKECWEAYQELVLVDDYDPVYCDPFRTMVRLGGIDEEVVAYCLKGVEQGKGFAKVAAIDGLTELYRREITGIEGKASLGNDVLAAKEMLHGFAVVPKLAACLEKCCAEKSARLFFYSSHLVGALCSMGDDGANALRAVLDKDCDAASLVQRELEGLASSYLASDSVKSMATGLLEEYS